MLVWVPEFTFSSTVAPGGMGKFPAAPTLTVVPLPGCDDGEPVGPDAGELPGWDAGALGEAGGPDPAGLAAGEAGLDGAGGPEVVIPPWQAVTNTMARQAPAVSAAVR